MLQLFGGNLGRTRFCGPVVEVVCATAGQGARRIATFIAESARVRRRCDVPRGRRAACRTRFCGKKACFPKAWRMDTCIRRTHFCEGGGVDAGETVPVSAESAACRSVPISACCAAEMGTLCCLPLFRGRRNGYAAGIAAGKGAGRFASGRRRLYASVPVSADAVAEMSTLTGGECAPSFAFAEMGTLFPLARPAGRPGRRAPPGVRGAWVSGIMRSPGVGRLAAGHHVFHDL